MSSVAGQRLEKRHSDLKKIASVPENHFIKLANLRKHFFRVWRFLTDRLFGYPLNAIKQNALKIQYKNITKLRKTNK